VLVVLFQPKGLMGLWDAWRERSRSVTSGTGPVPNKALPHG
jgi:hypothetical protein